MAIDEELFAGLCDGLIDRNVLALAMVKSLSKFLSESSENSK
jgi:hypothetical protein